MRTPQLHHALPVLTAVLLGVVVVLGGHRAAPPIAVAAQDDFAGLINIDNGRQLYLECRGAGSPTVVLEAGYRSSARAWSEDFRQLGAPRMMVFAGVAGFTRVCAYDRPGTVAPLKDDVRPSRSDPVPQPRTAPDAVADLHRLPHAAGIPGPYVLAGHSLGGLFVRLYASIYPREVVGLILVDAYSERLETLMTPEQWAALVRFNVRSGSDNRGLRRSRDAGVRQKQRRDARGGVDYAARPDAIGSPRPRASVRRAEGHGGLIIRCIGIESCARQTRTWRCSSRTRASSSPKSAVTFRHVLRTPRLEFPPEPVVRPVLRFCFEVALDVIAAQHWIAHGRKRESAAVIAIANVWERRSLRQDAEPAERIALLIGPQHRGRDRWPAHA